MHTEHNNAVRRRLHIMRIIINSKSRSFAIIKSCKLKYYYSAMTLCREQIIGTYNMYLFLYFFIVNIRLYLLIPQSLNNISYLLISRQKFLSEKQNILINSHR